MSRPKVEFKGIIAAYPGFYVLETMADYTGYPAVEDKRPVIAWVLDDDFIPHPVTLYGVQTESDILHPDGSIAVSDNGWCQSVEEWIARQQREYTEKRGGPK